MGKGLDIGGKPDPLCLYSELFPSIDCVTTWDWEDGDAQFLAGVQDSAYDFVHSSHCLEHLADPREGIKNWFRVIKPGGYLIVTVPDEDLYEQGVFPSEFNGDHKWTFTIFKQNSWSERSINLVELLMELGGDAEAVKVELLNATFRYELPRYDQSLSPVAESGIEMVIRRRTIEERKAGGRFPTQVTVPIEQRLHLNQYRDDLQTLKQANASRPPFTNDSDI